MFVTIVKSVRSYTTTVFVWSILRRPTVRRPNRECPVHKSLWCWATRRWSASGSTGWAKL